MNDQDVVDVGVSPKGRPLKKLRDTWGLREGLLRDVYRADCKKLPQQSPKCPHRNLRGRKACSVSILGDSHGFTQTAITISGRTGLKIGG